MNISNSNPQGNPIGGGYDNAVMVNAESGSTPVEKSSKFYFFNS
jgi:hypothetical protein